MLVEDLRIEQGGGVTSFVATVRWEDSQRDPFDLVFTVDASDAELVELCADAFRVPGAVVAWRDGEARLAGGGPMCTVLKNGLASSLSWLDRWSDDNGAIPAIDVPARCVHGQSRSVGSSGAFVSGGVDSTALLVANHRSFAPEDPLRISLGIVIVGIQPNRWTGWSDVRERLQAAREDLAWLETGFDISVIPVATNLRTLKRSSHFWQYEYQGAALAGVGHLFSKTLSNLAIASTWEIPYLDNWGSHPLLDHGYGSHSLRIWHELAHLGRLEKTQLIATRPELLEHLNVCNTADAGDQNCGRCEKCLRTKLALETMSLQTTVSAFAHMAVEPGDLRRIRIWNRGLEGEYLELVEGLAEAGRGDLAATIQRKVRQGRLLRSRVVRRAVQFARALEGRLLPGKT